jgi:hypothetical protein
LIKKETEFLFILESGGNYNMSDEKVMDNMKEEIRTRMQSLAVPAAKIASEFYTADEMVSGIFVRCQKGEFLWCF